MNIEMDEGFKLIRSLKISDMQSLKDEITESTAEGLERVYLNGRYGYINNKGEEVVSPKYDDAEDFHEGLASVILHKRQEFIDNTGHIIEELGYLCRLNDVTYIVKKQLFQIFIDGVNFMVPLEYIKSLNFIEKISVNEFNSKNIEKIKTIMNKCKKAKIVKEYYDLNINGKILSFKTAEAREAALKQIDFTDTTKGRQYIKIL